MSWNYFICTPRLCVDEMISLAHPGQNVIMPWFSSSESVGGVLFFPLFWWQGEVRWAVRAQPRGSGGCHQCSLLPHPYKINAKTCKGHAAAPTPAVSCWAEAVGREVEISELRGTSPAHPSPPGRRVSPGAWQTWLMSPGCARGWTCQSFLLINPLHPSRAAPAEPRLPLGKLHKQTFVRVNRIWNGEQNGSRDAGLVLRGLGNTQNDF